MNPIIIHISDLHFHIYPQNILECKAKRILGMGEFAFSARQTISSSKSKTARRENSPDEMGSSGDQRRFDPTFNGT